VAITKDQLQPADLVLFSANGSVVTHVGLYIGDGKIIHASTATTGVIISDLYSTYYVNHYYAARRIL
jgi:cell wall-associated NlpC family hydrolase